MLRALDQVRINRREMAGDNRGLRLKSLVGDDLVDDSQFPRALYRQTIFAQEDDLFGDLRPNEPGQQHNDDASTKLELGLTKEGGFASNGYIAGEAQFESARKAGASNSCNRWLWAMPKAHNGIEILAQNWLPLVKAGRAALHLFFQ